jgi:hypothetical protein
MSTPTPYTHIQKKTFSQKNDNHLIHTYKNFFPKKRQLSSCVCLTHDECAQTRAHLHRIHIYKIFFSTKQQLSHVCALHKYAYTHTLYTHTIFAKTTPILYACANSLAYTYMYTCIHVQNCTGIYHKYNFAYMYACIYTHIYISQTPHNAGHKYKK